MWLEHLAASTQDVEPYPFPCDGGELDFRPLLRAVAIDRERSRASAEIARAFHEGVAQGLCHSILTLCEQHNVDTVACSGGVFQNELLSAAIKSRLPSRVHVWTNHRVPCNDGGVSLGQAALAVFCCGGIRRPEVDGVERQADAGGPGG